MLVFTHDDWTIEVEPATWADIFNFLLQCGWQLNISTYHLLSVGHVLVMDQDAKALAAAGRIVLEETLKDPLSGYSRIRFDMGKFAEIIEFASDGQFTITQRP